MNYFSLVVGVGDSNTSKQMENGLLAYSSTRVCVLSSGIIIIWGRVSHKWSFKFHFFRRNGTPTGQTFQGTCRHIDNLHLLSSVIHGIEHLVVFCRDCKNIKLINTEELNQDPVAAFKGSADAICFGDAGILYMIEESSHHLLVIDCSKQKFTFTCNIPIDVRADSVCYMRSSKLIILCSEKNNIIHALTNNRKVI